MKINFKEKKPAWETVENMFSSELEIQTEMIFKIFKVSCEEISFE
jgi:hypothetical protein